MLPDFSALFGLLGHQVHQVSGATSDVPFVIESNAFISGEFYLARKAKIYISVTLYGIWGTRLLPLWQSEDGMLDGRSPRKCEQG